MNHCSPSRVITYIDGFNLYYGLRAAGFRRFYWLDMGALSQNLLQSDQTLERTRYFTARISGPTKHDPFDKAEKIKGKRMRQSRYLDALGTRSGLDIFEGHYLQKILTCHTCKHRWNRPEEKMTDVNIATELLVDAYEGAFDAAILISGDSDLAPPTKKIRKKFSDKRIVVAFPPERHSVELAHAANASFTIGRSKLRDSQLPDSVTMANGHILNRPKEWQ